MIIAQNISRLRREAGMTQLDLAERLNYSDKAVSKWERGESLPDIGTFKELAALFSVSVDYLLTDEHAGEETRRREYTARQKRNHIIITAMSVALVWLAATFAFVNIDLIAGGSIPRHWLAFVMAVPVTAVVLLVFNGVWGRRQWTFPIVSLLLWSVLAAIYLCALQANLWLIFVIGVPAQIIILLWAGLKVK